MSPTVPRVLRRNTPPVRMIVASGFSATSAAVVIAFVTTRRLRRWTSSRANSAVVEPESMTIVAPSATSSAARRAIARLASCCSPARSAYCDSTPRIATAPPCSRRTTPRLGEPGQVAPDGHLRDAQAVGQVRHPDRAGLARQVGDRAEAIRAAAFAAGGRARRFIRCTQNRS